MSTAILNVNQFNAAPFPDTVRQIIETAFQLPYPLRRIAHRFHRVLDRQSLPDKVRRNHQWTTQNRDHRWYRPGDTGLNGEVYVEAIRRRNYCRNCVTRKL